MIESQLDIFEIERFAVHDGPGIRTAIFFQGCPLRCRWCANPESQTVGKHILFFENRCVGCGRCINVCKAGAIQMKEGKAQHFVSKCISCGICVDACPCAAVKLSGKKIGCDELFEIVMRDRDYYTESGGGVTLTGGEPLLQIERMIPFLENCKKAEIHIAFETCGCVDLKHIEEALKYADLFLFDLKSLDKKRFLEYTNGDLDIVIRAFERICKVDSRKITVRVPVIPQFNEDEIRQIILFAADHGIKELHLLPYHTLGVIKYKQLGRMYEYPVRQAMDPAVLKAYQPIGENAGITVKIGG